MQKNLAQLQDKARRHLGIPVTVEKDGDLLIMTAVWEQQSHQRSGELPTETVTTSERTQVIYDLSTDREIGGRLSQMGLRFSDILMFRAGEQ